MTRRSRPIKSEDVTYGHNATRVAYKDSRYVTCNNCGFISHLDRDNRAYPPSRQSDGVTRAETQLNGAVSAGDTTITVDSTTGFTTPSSGSITAFATRRNGTIVTSAAHGLKNDGRKVIISGTTNYNGTFPISEITTDTFVIGAAFVADDATGTWKELEYIFIHDAGTYATVESTTTAYDVSSTYTAATGGPRVDRVSYTGLSSTTFTGCVGALAHDDNMYVRDEIRGTNGCPLCGKLHYDT